jgi:tRNA threonylcarbamoyladenosine biosynthesis protein TsaB
MKILAIDTATEACSAALWQDGAVYERFVERPQGHGELILGMIDGLLAETGLTLNDLDGLAFGQGPGSFTGVRIAVAVAQGIGFGSALPLLPVSNLAALAQRCYREYGVRRVLPALDARMGEVYFGIYKIQGGYARAVVLDQVISPDRLPLPEDRNWLGVGRGWAAYGKVMRERLAEHLTNVVPEMLCSAQDIASLAVPALREGRAISPEAAVPLYLRDQVTHKGVATRGL